MVQPLGPLADLLNEGIMGSEQQVVPASRSRHTQVLPFWTRAQDFNILVSCLSLMLQIL